MGEKQIEKLRKGIDDYRRSAGRYRIDVAETIIRDLERRVRLRNAYRGTNDPEAAGVV